VCGKWFPQRALKSLEKTQFEYGQQLQLPRCPPLAHPKSARANYDPGKMVLDNENNNMRQFPLIASHLSFSSAILSGLLFIHFVNIY